MADEQFQITYDGPALGNNRMDVAILAPALMGLSEAFQVANRAVSPTGPSPGLQIAATRPGSFAVDLLLLDPATIIDRAIGLFSGREVSAAVNAGSLLGYVLAGITFLRHLSHRRIRKQETIRDGWVRITFDDGSTLDLPSISVQLAGNLDFRRATNDMVEPLRTDGIDSVDLVRGNERVRVDSTELGGFDVPEAGETLLSDQTREVALRLRNVAFTPGNKWRVSDGDNDLFVVVSDAGFVERVNTNQESFGAGDILRCRLHTQQWQTPGGAIRNDNTIVQVLEHIRGARVVPLPFEDLPAESVEEDTPPDGPDEGQPKAGTQ